MASVCLLVGGSGGFEVALCFCSIVIQSSSSFLLVNIQRAEKVGGRPERCNLLQKRLWPGKDGWRRGLGWARTDLRLFGAERSPAGSGCDPAPRSGSHQSQPATWRTRPQTSDRLGSIRAAAARSLEARRHSDHLLCVPTKGLSFSAS